MFWELVSSKGTLENKIPTLKFVCALKVTGDFYRMRS